MFRVVISAVAILSLALSGYMFFSSNATTFVYVNNNRVLTEYEGFKDAKIKATNRAEKWKAEVDSMKLDYSRYTRSLDGKKLNQAEENLIELKYKRIVTFEQEAIKKIQAIEEELTQEVVGQIDSRMKEFGEAHDYEMIFGVTDSGNLLYAKEGKDITTELLNYLNAKYRGN